MAMNYGNPDQPNEFLVSHLMRLYGINRGRAQLVCAHFGFAPHRARVKHVGPNAFLVFRRFFERRFLMDKVLKKLLTVRLRTFLKEGSHRARRMLWNLPSRGQRTRTNARTARAWTLRMIPKAFYTPQQKTLPLGRGPIANKKKIKK